MLVLAGCYNSVMFRISVYTPLGAVIGLIVGTVVTTSNNGVLAFAAGGGVFGLMVGVYLNSAVRYEDVWYLDNLLWGMGKSGPWVFLPRELRHRLLLGIRARFTEEPRDPSFLDAPQMPVPGGKLDKKTGLIVKIDEMGDRTCDI